MNILDKDEAWTMYNEFFLRSAFLGTLSKPCVSSAYDEEAQNTVWNEFGKALGSLNDKGFCRWEAASAIDASYEASKYLNEFNNLYRLLMDIALECEPWISSDDEIECKASYFSQMAGMYDDISPEELRLSYAEGKCYEESSNRFVELTVEQTKFIVLMGSTIIENCWLELRSHNEGKEEL
jgi:hypothetical protein